MRCRPILFAFLLLAGCGRFLVDAPGLGPRPIEGQPVPSPDAAASEPETPATPALAAKLAAILAEAETAHARFERQRLTDTALLDRGRAAPEGSEGWLAAQQSLSALSAQTGALRDAAEAIDALRIDPAFAAAGDRAAIEAAAEKVESLAAAERAALGS